MKSTLAFVLCFIVQSAPARQVQSTSSLLDRLAGRWILQGTIDGKQTTHDVTAEWVLQHQYLQLHEVSREKDSLGLAAYEAIVYLGWDQQRQQYGCYWMDITGGGTFSEHGIGRAKQEGNEIPFLFTYSDTVAFHTTFAFEPKTDTWKWVMDDDNHGKRQPFARVTLTRTH